MNRTSVRRALLGLIGWGLIAALVVVALWPAMWVDPSGALNEVLGLGTYFATTPHESGNYFLGQPTDDPGLLFYPLAFLFRITPLMLIGILASWLLLRSRERRSMGFYLFALWSFILLFMAFVSLGVKKFDRYALPTILLADVLAGAGLAYLLAWLRRRLPRPKLVGGLGLALVLILQVALLWPHVPYYLTYYNPLLGGGQGATAAIMVGWGEGCDLAARYLNRKEHAAGLDVVTRYPGTCFGALFEGTAWDTDIDRGLGDQEGTGFPWYAADYVVLYVNQVQRNLPSRAFVAFFQAQEPEYVAHIAGLPYAWVYRMPATIPDELPPAFHTPVHKVPAGNFADQVWLANYAICDTAYQEKASFTAGETVHLVLRWRTERLLPVQYKVFAHVYDDQGQLITQADDALGGPKAERLLKKPQNKIMNYLTLPLPSTMPPGTYRIAIGLYDEQTGARLPRADGAGDHILLDATITVQGP